MSAAIPRLAIACAVAILFATADESFGQATAARPPAGAPAVDLYQRLEEMHHTAWTGRSGLTGSPVRLAQTADGFLWIGTSNGLFRFDGVAFERYQPAEGELPGAAVNALRPTRDGGLWVGFGAGGASFIAADGALTNYTREQGLPFGGIRDFAEDHDGVIWVAATGGLARLEGGRWRQVRLDWNYPCRSAWRVMVQQDGTLWVGGASPNKVLFLPKGTRAFQDSGMTIFAHSFTAVGSTVFISDDGGAIHRVRRGPGGSLDTRLFARVSHLALGMDPAGTLWAVGPQGIMRFRLDPNADAGGDPVASAERLTLEQGLSGRRGIDVLVDREGNVWVATAGGLDRFRRRNLTWRTHPALADTASLAADERGEMWVVSWEPPHLWRAHDGVSIPGAPSQLQGGYPDRDGAIWIRRNNELLRWKDGRIVPLPRPQEVVERGYSFNVIAAATDRAGRLWASVNGLGQFYRQDDRWTFVPVLPEPDRRDWTASQAHVDADDRVWLMYRDELAMIDRGKTRVFTKADGVDAGPLIDLAGRDRELWVSGERGLLFLRDGRFHRVRTDPDAGFGAVRNIVFTRGGLWLAAAAGVVHIPDAEVRRLFDDPAYGVRFEVFDLVSDLPEALSAYRPSDIAAADGAGNVWFLTTSGLARVDPRRIVRNTVPPPVVIGAVTADDKRYTPRGELSLPALTRTLRIDYTALSLTIPERVRFRYRLEGWETDWHDAGTRREVSYTDLKPGRYVFRVVACNNDGLWNETGTTLTFTVAPAWYQTWWFTGLIGTSLLGGVWGMYRLRVRRVSAALSARFDERLAERTRLARDLHDTLLQTVQGSKMVADDALDRVDEPEHVRRSLERLSEWLGRAVTEGRAALHSLRASTASVNDLAESFRRAADNPTKPAAMTVAVAVVGASRDLHPIVRDEIYRIGYEAMCNAYAHSGASRLEVELEYGQDLMLRVADNGAGIDSAIASSGKRGRFGLPGMRERAANIGATITVEGLATGTRVTLVVPGRSVFQRSAGSPSI